jgi:hypothetical protein
VTQVVDLIQAGRTHEARELQMQRANPLADRLERLTNRLVNKAEADMVARRRGRAWASGFRRSRVGFSEVLPN